MVQHLIEDQPLRELVSKTAANSPEDDVLSQVRELSQKLFAEDCIDEYSKPGAAGRLWVMWDWGDNKIFTPSIASGSTTASVSLIADGQQDNAANPEPGFGGRPRLLGFLLAKLLPKANVPGGEAFTIVYTAVPDHLRGKGVGRKLVASVLKQGRARQNIAVVTCSALAGAIQFWERCGLKQYPDAMELKEGSAAGQVYMEISVKGKKGKSRKR